MNLIGIVALERGGLIVVSGDCEVIGSIRQIVEGELNNIRIRIFIQSQRHINRRGSLLGVAPFVRGSAVRVIINVVTGEIGFGVCIPLKLHIESKSWRTIKKNDQKKRPDIFPEMKPLCFPKRRNIQRPDA